MRHSLCFCFTLLLAVGCGDSKSKVDNSQDPEAYARDVKQLVLDHVAIAAKSREPADQMAVIIAELEQRDRPLGSYQPTYEKLLTAAREIHAESKKANGRPGNLNARLNQLRKMAESLPGQVDVRGEAERSND